MPFFEFTSLIFIYNGRIFSTSNYRASKLLILLFKKRSATRIYSTFFLQSRLIPDPRRNWFEAQYRISHFLPIVLYTCNSAPNINTFSSHNQDSAHRIVNVPSQPGICPENLGKTVHFIKCSVAYFDSLLCIRREGILLIFSTDNKQKNNFFNEMKCSFKLSSQTVQKYSV